MSRSWTRAWLFGAVLGLLAMPAVADDGREERLRKEIESLRSMVESQADQIDDQKAEIDALRVDGELNESAVERAVDDVLARRAAEGSGTAGFMGGKFRLNDGGDGNSLEIGGRLHFDLLIFETNTPDQANRFRFRRVRLHALGTVADDWRYKVEYDFAASALRDAYIAVFLSDLLGLESEGIASIEMSAGQRKVPFSRSDLLSSNTINTIERPMIVRSLAPAFDQGLFFSNSYMDGRLWWMLSCTNGTDGDDELAYTGRIVFNPMMGDEGSMLEPLSVGASANYQSNTDGSTYNVSTPGGGGYSSGSGLLPSGSFSRGEDVRLGLDAHWRTGPFGFTTECLYGRQEDAFGDDDFELWGVYCQFNYMICGGDWSENPKEGLEAVLQFEYVEAKAGSDDADLWACTLGFNYYFNKHVRFMMNYVATDLSHDDVGTPHFEDGSYSSHGLDHNLLFRLQLVF